MHRTTGRLLPIGAILLAACAAVEDDGTPLSAAPSKGVPGETLGDATLQRDTMMPVVMAAVTKMSNKDCPASDIRLQNTKVLSQPREVEGMAVYTKWEELWTVSACDETVDVEVTYMEHFLDGTSIHAR